MLTRESFIPRLSSRPRARERGARRAAGLDGAARPCGRLPSHGPPPRDARRSGALRAEWAPTVLRGAGALRRGAARLARVGLRRSADAGTATAGMKLALGLSVHTGWAAAV